MNRHFIYSFILLLCVCCHTGAQNRCDSLHVTHYTLNLDLTDIQGRQLDGHCTLKLIPKQPLSEIRLDLLHLQVDSVRMNGAILPFTHNDTVLHIRKSIIPALVGDTLDVEVWYHGRPYCERFGGFYFSGEYAFNMGVAITSIPHNFGKSWFPCVDEFTDKASYTCHIRTQKQHRAVCGGLLTDSLYLADSSRIWTWELAQAIPTYLASVAAGPYEVIRDCYTSIDGRNLPIEIFVPGSLCEQAKSSFSRLKPILSMFEEHFGPYPFDRIGYVGVPFGSGAMEHATNIAYPIYAIDGKRTYESLYAHELSHAWFGDAVTCEKAEDMWLNEGFARWCEGLLAEYFSHEGEQAIANGEAYRKWFEKLHRSVLLQTPSTDGGYHALDQVPQEHTYGSTTYDKGAVTVYSLRSYLGDSLFFHCMKTYLQKFAYRNASTDDFLHFLSEESGRDMENFFLERVKQPGFLQAVIDSVRETENGTDVKVYLRQKTHHAEQHVPVMHTNLGFLMENGKMYHCKDLHWDGLTGCVETSVPHGIVWVVVDPESRLSDASIDTCMHFSSRFSGSISFGDGDMAMKDLRCDSGLLYMEHIWVTPDAPQDNPHVYRTSSTHYWRIGCTDPEWSAGNLYFTYRAQSKDDPDYELIQGYQKKDYLLLYRRDASENWRRIPFSQNGTVGRGNIGTPFARNGEYCLAVGDTAAMRLPDSIGKSSLRIYPNPTRDYFHIDLNGHPELCLLRIYSSDGRYLGEKVLQNETAEISTQGMPAGTYFLEFLSSDGKICEWKKICIR